MTIDSYTIAMNLYVYVSLFIKCLCRQSKNFCNSIIFTIVRLMWNTCFAKDFHIKALRCGKVVTENGIWHFYNSLIEFTRNKIAVTFGKNYKNCPLLRDYWMDLLTPCFYSGHHLYYLTENLKDSDRNKICFSENFFFKKMFAKEHQIMISMR